MTQLSCTDNVHALSQIIRVVAITQSDHTHLPDRYSTQTWLQHSRVRIGNHFAHEVPFAVPFHLMIMYFFPEKKQNTRTQSFDKLRQSNSN